MVEKAHVVRKENMANKQGSKQHSIVDHIKDTCTCVHTLSYVK